MGATFKMSASGVGQLLRSPGLEAEVLRRAELIKSIAEGLSPVGGPGDVHHGAYKASWSAKLTNKKVGRSQKRRATATVTNSSYYARWVEYGSERVPAHHVLLRAAQIGGR